MEGIRKLNERLNFKEIKVYNDLNTNLIVERKEPTMEPVVLSQEELLFYLSQYLTVDEPNILEFKA